MPAAPRISPSELFSSDEWEPFKTRSAWVGLLLVAHAWGVIALAITAGVLWPVLIPISVMIVGTRQLGLAILMHEAAHGGLSTSLKVNDWVGQWLCAVPVGAALLPYRTYHLTHHRFAQQPEDPDLPLASAFPVSKASFRRKIVRDITGQTFFKQRVLIPIALLRGRSRIGGEVQHDYETLVTGRSLLPFLATNLILLCALALIGIWWAFFVLWLLPMAVWLPFVTRLRNIAEHACVEGSDKDPFRAARTTRASWWERALIAPYWVNFHAEHHLFMHVQCWRLPRLHSEIQKRPQATRMEMAPGYLSVIALAVSKKGSASGTL